MRPNGNLRILAELKPQKSGIICHRIRDFHIEQHKKLCSNFARTFRFKSNGPGTG